MALDKITFHLPFTHGIDRRAGEVYLPAPQLELLQDMTLDRTGELNKRLGVDQMPDDINGGGTTSGTTVAVGVRDENELVQVNDRTMYSWTQPTGFKTSGDWTDRGDAWNCYATQRHIPAAISNGDEVWDYARVGNIEVVVFESGIVVLDANTKGTIGTKSITVDATRGARCRADDSGTYVYVVWPTSATEISVLRIRQSSVISNLAATPTTYSPTATAAFGNTSTWDCCWDDVNDRLLVVTVGTSNSSYNLYSFSSDLGTTAYTPTTIGSNLDVFCIAAVEGRACVFYYKTSGTAQVQFDVYGNNNLSFFVARATGFVPEPTSWGVVGSDDGTTARLWCFMSSIEDETGSTGSGPEKLHVHKITVEDPAGGGFSATGVGFLKRSHLLSRPAVYKRDDADNTPIVMVCNDVRPQFSAGSAPLLRGTNSESSESVYVALFDGRAGYEEFTTSRGMQPLARMLPARLAERDKFQGFTGKPGAADKTYLPKNLAPTTTDYLQFAVVFNVDNGTELLSFDFDEPQAYESVSVGRSLYFPGGYLSVYDGDTLKEAAPFSYPENVQALPTISGSGPLAVGDYFYACYWAMQNAQGEVVRSTALPGTVTISGSEDGVNLYVPTLPHTRLPSGAENIWLEVYRSEVNPTDINDPRYLVSGSPLYPRLGGTVLFNDPASDHVAFSEAYDDAEALLRPPDPTNSGALDQVPALAPRALAAGQNRLFYIGPDDTSEVYYSKLRGEGEMVAFNEGLTGTIPAPGGVITGIYPWEDKVTVFRERAIYSLAGVGPDNLGRGSYGLAQIVDPATGLTDPRAMAGIPAGLLFHSERSWHILNRADQVVYVGAGDDGLQFNTSTEKPGGCVVVPDQHKVICFSDTSGKTAVFDWLAQQWIAYTGDYFTPMARLYEGEPHWVRTASTSGVLYPAVDHADLSSNVGGLVETAWIKVDQGQGRFGQGGASGWGRFYWWELIGYVDGPSEVSPFAIEPVRVEVAYNYESSYEDTFQYLFVQKTRFRIRERFQGRYQKSAAVKFRIRGLKTDSTGTIYNLTIQALSIQVGLKSGVTRSQPATQE